MHFGFSNYNFLLVTPKYPANDHRRLWKQITINNLIINPKTKDNKFQDTQTCRNQQTSRVCCSWFLHVKSKLRIKFAYLVFIIFGIYHLIFECIWSKIFLKRFLLRAIVQSFVSTRNRFGQFSLKSQTKVDKETRRNVSHWI